MSIDFSLLMSVYAKESPAYLDQAFLSIWTNQTFKPSEVVLVKDGPLPKSLEQVIEKWALLLDKKMKVIALKQNEGLGRALNIGIQHCCFDLVARMDTDDISSPDRFEKLVHEFEMDSNLSLCGSYIKEFITDDPHYSAMRTVPLTLEQIRNSCELRNPFNHPSVMFKKSAILQAGGYKHMPFFEDYYLWLRVLSLGYTAKNVPQSLLNMRIDNGQIERRSGVKYLKYEISFYRRLYQDGLLRYSSFLFMTILRAPLRVLPRNLLSFLYKLTRKKNSICHGF